VIGLPVAVTMGMANVWALRARRAGRPLSQARRLAVGAQRLAAARLLGLAVAAALLGTVVIQRIELNYFLVLYIATVDPVMAALFALATRRAIDRAPR
jgi:hypothetical protein